MFFKTYNHATPPRPKAVLAPLLALLSLALFCGCAGKPISPQTSPTSADTIKPVKRAYKPSVPRPAPIYYASNVDTLTAPQVAYVQRLARSLKRFPEASITITGYADTVGSTGRNALLATQRAVKVANAFRKAGISSNMTITQGGEIPGDLAKARKTTITISP